MDNIENKGKLGYAIPLILIAFFVTFISVDMFFTYKAVTTHTGVISKNAYKNGLNYNETIKASNYQNTLSLDINIKLNEKELIAEIKDINNDLVNELKVKAYVIRPTQSDLDFDVKLLQNNDGDYQANIELPVNGQWKVRIVAINEKNQQIQKSRLFIIK